MVGIGGNGNSHAMIPTIAVHWAMCNACVNYKGQVGMQCG